MYSMFLQNVWYEDIVEAVEVFVVTFDPPLLPALQGSVFETQISVADDPPDYHRANRVLKVRGSGGSGDWPPNGLGARGCGMHVHWCEHFTSELI